MSSSHGLSPVCVHGEVGWDGTERERSSSSFNTTSPIILGPHISVLINLDYLLKAVSSNTVMLGVRALIRKFWEETIQSIAPPISLSLLFFGFFCFVLFVCVCV